METVIKQSENRFTSFLAFLFMVGLGAIPLWLAGGFVGWVFFLLFVLASLLPLSSIIRPGTSLLATENGNLVWWTARQGKRTEEASVPIDAIRKVIKWSQPGSRFVEIQLVLADKTVLRLPQGLLAEVNSKKIIGAIKGLSQAIEFEEAEEADEPANTLSGDADTGRHEDRRSSAKARKLKAQKGYTFSEKDVWKLALCFVVVGVALVVTAVVWEISTFRFVRAASSADGTIQEMNLVGRTGHRSYQFTIVFKDRSGQARTFTEPGNAYNRSDFTVGQQVHVAYDANNPSAARIVAFQTLWLRQTLIGVIGMVIAVIGSLATWQARKLYS
jgi:hypothetical protein